MSKKPKTEAEKLERVNEITAETEKLVNAIQLVRTQREAAELAEEPALGAVVQANDDRDAACDAYDLAVAHTESLKQQQELFEQELVELEAEAAEILKLEPADLDGTAVDEPFDGADYVIYDEVATAPEAFEIQTPAAHARLTNITDGSTEEFPE